MSFIFITFSNMVLELPTDLEITEFNLSFKNLSECQAVPKEQLNSRETFGFACPDLSRYTKLTKLDIRNHKITSLDNLPLSLIKLDCSSNLITSLENLHYHLQN